MNKGHIHMVGLGEKAQNARLDFLHPGFYLHSRFGNGDNILPQCRHGFFQLRGGQLGQILKGIKLQPQQQRFLRQDIQLPGVHGSQSLPEILIPGIEGSPFILRPLHIRLLAQQGQEFAIVLGAAELDGV